MSISFVISQFINFFVVGIQGLFVYYERFKKIRFANQLKQEA